jgi:succinoglycan biosynthesis protein ExoO
MKTPNLPEHAISTPSVSVIMANYNGAAHLAEAITSVQRQSLWDLKIIVSDDASTDDSVRVVVGLAAEDHRIRIVRSDRNGGPAAAHNRALAVARGEWIAIMDSDDLMHPDGSRNWSTQRVGTAPVLSPTISSSSTRTAPAPSPPARRPVGADPVLDRNYRLYPAQPTLRIRTGAGISEAAVPNIDPERSNRPLR